ncbi:MAG TPA: PilZ domain-containing protein [Anaerolineae bacterium]|nr:PilZ domain-containing protein [Anaerolineae bacterium]
MIEKRQQRRVQLFYHLRVFDRVSGNYTGRLVDITMNGIRILNEKPFDTGTEYSFRLDLTKVMSFEQHVDFDAECIWQEREFSSGVYNSGFKIIKITKKARGIIPLLIEQFGE